MSIAAMKRLELIALRRDREELFEKLQDLGCVQVIQETSDGEDAPQWAQSPPGEELAGVQARRDEAKAALDVLKHSGALEKKGLLAARPNVNKGTLYDEETSAKAQAAADGINAAQAECLRLDAEIARLESRRATLAPWLELDVPLETASTSAVTALFGSLPVQTDLEQVKEALGEAGKLCDITPAGADKDSRYLFLVCLKKVEGEVLTALQALGFARVTFRDFKGTAKENDRRLEQRLAELRTEREAAAVKTAGQPGDTGLLERYVDRLEQDVAREEAKGKLRQLGSTFCLAGWFPASEEERVKELLSAFTCAWEVRDPTEEEYPQVPVKLKNGPLTRCMNTITEMYSLPAYDGVDPNPLMFPFFVVFFGMMMADMAYGIAMIIGTQLVLRKTNPKESTRNFMELFFWCGISTFIWGAVTGGFLGDFIPQILRIIDPTSTFTMPALFTPLDDTIAILLGSLVLGAIQVFTGMLISVIRKIQGGEFIDALFNEITWWIIIAGGAMAILGLGFGKYILIAGALMLALGGTRNAKGFGKLTSLVGLVYNGVSGFFSDILSYLRLMALMLAGSVISQVFNTLGSVFGNVIAFVIISLIGNVLNLALNLLGCYVHDLRLQCLEYFGRFYKEGGKPFRPLSIETKYVNVLKEEM